MFQSSGLLNFAAINQTASGLTVLRTDDFLRKFDLLSHLESYWGPDLKAIATKLQDRPKISSKYIYFFRNLF